MPRTSVPLVPFVGLIADQRMTLTLLSFITLPKTRLTVHQISGLSAYFQVYCSLLQAAHQNTRVNGTNFVKNRHKKWVDTLK